MCCSVLCSGSTNSSCNLCRIPFSCWMDVCNRETWIRETRYSIEAAATAAAMHTLCSVLAGRGSCPPLSRLAAQQHAHRPLLPAVLLPLPQLLEGVSVMAEYLRRSVGDQHLPAAHLNAWLHLSEQLEGYAQALNSKLQHHREASSMQYSTC